MGIGSNLRMVSNNRHGLDWRFGFCFFLFTYCLFALNERRHLLGENESIEHRLKILRQMQSYAEQACGDKDENPSLDVEEDMETVRMTKRTDVTHETVSLEVTFIIMSPTIRCMSDKFSWLRNRYKNAKIYVALDVGSSVVNRQSVSEPRPSNGFFLGGFSSRAESLNRAIEIVSSKYFLVLDHSVDLARMQSNFVEILLSNMPGFDVLGSSDVNTDGEFTVPCRRLILSNWSFSETFEYNISGNVLRCVATSQYFLGRTEAFKQPARPHLFDPSLPFNWLEDFFLRFKDILEVGVVPEVLIYHKIPQYCFHAPPREISFSEQVDKILPFAEKHHIFYLETGNGTVSMCHHSTKLKCSKANIGQRWKLGDCMSTGLTAYPFIIESIQEALHFGTRRLRESEISFVIEGGTLLGLVKLRDILPWDHGDVDTFVYSTRRKIIDMVKKTYRDYGYIYWLRHSGFHTYVSNDPSSLNGCIVYLSRRVKPDGIIYMKHHGKLFPVKRKIFKFLRDFYGSSFLESHMKSTNGRSYCTIPGHHACMPDCRWDGCGGGHIAFPGIL